MALSNIAPITIKLHTSSQFLPRPNLPRIKIKPRTSKLRISTTLAALSDPHVLQLAETLEDSLPSTSTSPPPPLLLQKLRESSSESLLSTPWPSRKDEPFRFTDTSFLKNSRILPIKPPENLDSTSLIDSAEALFPTLTIIDGYLANSVSELSELSTELPDGVYVGGLGELNSETISKRVSEYVSGFQGDLFWSLNGVGAPELVLVYVPEGCRVEKPLHLRYVSVEGSDKGSKSLPISNPRVLVLVEKGGEICIVEEYVNGSGDGDGSGEKCYWNNSVIDVVIGDGAKVDHSYIQTQSFNAAHTKWTSVRQESASTYKLTEVSTGGKLCRHNLHVQQYGPDTETEVSTFHLSLGDQTQDLHSRLIFDHPRAFSRQIHKCIVAHPSGQAVFDGNVQVNRFAQQTDAGQLTRSLLLVPKGTVNVKPNLQIIADDVKCSHGAAISDLEDDQLFYFLARGIDAEAARRALIFSFATEVTQQFPQASMRKKVDDYIKNLLNPSS